MKTSFFAAIFCLSTMAGLAQKPEADIYSAYASPVIDGVIDAMWAEASAHNIALSYKTEMPTLGAPGKTTWKAVYDEKGIYILLQVTDDVFSPCYEDCNNYEFDKMELYFDCNEVLEDGLGTNALGNGHYQVAPGYNETMLAGGEMTDERSGIKYAHVLNDPNVVWEYLVQWSYLLDKDGLPMNQTNPMGFDVTVTDNDTPGSPERRRAVWANDGKGPTADESWNNMDDCGIIHFLGACCVTPVTGLVVGSSENTISTDNGSMQMEVTITPPDATNVSIRWSVENITGRAIINENGLLTAKLDGTVKVIATAKDGSGISAEKIIEISDQLATPEDLNLLLNGTFDMDGEGLPKFWGGGDFLGTGGIIKVLNGVAICDPQPYQETWRFQFTQSGNEVGWKLCNDTSYILQFDAWADEARSINLDFEDNGTNQYTRIGFSQDANAVGGNSEWVVPLTTTRTSYTQHTTITRLQENSQHKLFFMLSLFDAPVYLDNIALYTIGDFELAQMTRRTTLTTNKLEQLWNDSARVEASVIGITRGNLLQHGLCWSTSPNPTISGNKSTLGQRSTKGKFHSSIRGLVPGTKYYVRAYATDSLQTVYGNELQIYSSMVPIALKANAGQSKVYGSADPVSYSYMISAGSVMNGIPLKGALVRAEGEIPGHYLISPGTLTAENNANYSISFEPADFSITPKQLTISGTKAMNKIYDGNTNAILNIGTLSGRIQGDTVILQAGAAHFADKNIGYKTVTVDGYSLLGKQAAYYTCTFPSTSLKATITPRYCNITGIEVSDKMYDGTLFAGLTGGTIQNVLPGDTVILMRGTGKFISKNAGNNNLVNVTGFRAGGPDSVNYMITQPTGLMGNILPAPILVKANNQTRKAGEPNPVFTLSYSGFIQPESEAVFTRKPIGFCTADLSSAPGEYAILAGGGIDDNYAFFYESGTLTITPGTGIGSNPLKSIRIFPNPAREFIMILSSENIPAGTYQLLDLAGRIVLENKFSGSHCRIGTEQLNESAYILRVQDGTGNISIVKIVKIR